MIFRISAPQISRNQLRDFRQKRCVGQCNQRKIKFNVLPNLQRLFSKSSRPTIYPVVFQNKKVIVKMHFYLFKKNSIIDLNFAFNFNW